MSVRVSVAIPTYNRPKDLEVCLRSVAAQSRPPIEVLVVDDGELDPAPYRAIFDGSPVAFRYFKKDRRGLCRSRNLAIREFRGDVLVFLDDDTELDPGYVEGYASIFEADPEGRIGGLSGAPKRFLHGKELPAEMEPTFFVRLERFFLLSSARGGRVLPSGFRSPMVAPGDLTPVEFLQGGNMAVRRSVCERFQFDETLDRFGGYSLGEDVIFSYPVGRVYALYSTSRAKMKHFASPGPRPDKQGMNRMKVIHQYRFMHKTMKGGLLNHLAFAWAMLGMICIHAIVWARRPDGARWRNLRGVVSGIGHVLRHPAADETV